MAITYPLLKTIEIDGVKMGIDPDWGEAYGARISIASFTAEAWYSTDTITIPRGMYILTATCNQNSAASTGATTRMIEILKANNDRVSAVTEIAASNYACPMETMTIGRYSEETSIYARTKCSRAITLGPCILDIRAFRIADWTNW